MCVDISIFLGLSVWRMILIRLTYKKGSLSGGHGRVSPSASHRCEPACSGNLFYPFPETIYHHSIPCGGFFLPRIQRKTPPKRRTPPQRDDVWNFPSQVFDGPHSEKPTHSFPAPSKLKTASQRQSSHLL